jgi:hypothetical protein
MEAARLADHTLVGKAINERQLIRIPKMAREHIRLAALRRGGQAGRGRSR